MTEQLGISVLGEPTCQPFSKPCGANAEGFDGEEPEARLEASNERWQPS